MPVRINDRVASEHALHSHAARQRGLVTWRQAEAIGWSRQRLHAWCRRGWLRNVHRGVYAVAGAPETWEQRVLAAVLAAGTGAVASHRTALALHRVGDWKHDDAHPIEISVPAHRCVTVRNTLVHRVILPGDDVRAVGGIPCTTYERTLVDSAALVGLGALARALDQGLVGNSISMTSSQRTLDRLRVAPGRRRVPLHTLLAERSPESDRAESAPEIRVLAAIRGAGLPDPTPQHQVTVEGERFRLDAAFPEHRIGLEYQGWDPHRTRSAFDADLRRDRMLRLAGRTVVYFTSKSTDADIASTVRRLMSRSTHD
jgi:predicted transcriptional regulator of viral defense system